MNPFKFLADLASGLAAFFRFREKKQELVNTPEMQANARSENRAEIHDNATKAVATDDLEKLRKDLAE